MARYSLTRNQVVPVGASINGVQILACAVLAALAGYLWGFVPAVLITVAAVCLVVSTGLMFRARFARRVASANWSWIIRLLWAGWYACATSAVLIGFMGGRELLAAGVGIGAGALGFVQGKKRLDALLDRQGRNSDVFGDGPSDLDRLRAMSARDLARGELSGRERLRVEFNQLWAELERIGHRSGRDTAGLAATRLEAMLLRPDLNPSERCVVGLELVRMRDTLAARDDNDDGYLDALELVDRLARDIRDPAEQVEAQTAIALARVRYASYVLSSRREDIDPGQFRHRWPEDLEVLWRDCVSRLRAAIAARGPGRSNVTARLHTQLGMVLLLKRVPGALAELRTGYELVRNLSVIDRAEGQLLYAQGLTETLDPTAPEARSVLREAKVLARDLLKHKTTFDSLARPLLIEIQRLEREL